MPSTARTFEPRDGPRPTPIPNKTASRSKPCQNKFVSNCIKQPRTMISTKTIFLLGVAAVASTASADERMLGGNGLCASPGSLGPNALTGAFSPVEDPEDDSTIATVAEIGSLNYLSRRSLQSDVDKQIFRICRPRTIKMLDTVEVDAACSQVVAGKNYVVKSTFEVPCSRGAEKRLPRGVSLVRSIITEAYEDLEGQLDLKAVSATED